jgi:hypothetical protein
MSKLSQYLITAVLVASAIAVTVAVVQRGSFDRLVHILFHDHSGPHSDEDAHGQPEAAPAEQDEPVAGQ